MSTDDPQGGPPRRPNFDAYLKSGPSRPAHAGRLVQYALVLVGLALAARVGWSVWQFSESNVPKRNDEAAIDLAEVERNRQLLAGNDVLVPSVQSPNAVRGVIDVDPTEGAPFASPTAASPTATAQGRLDMAKSRQRELVQLSAELGRRLAAWREEDRQWQTVVVPLLDSDPGKSLADNPAAAKGFRAVYEQSRPEISRATAIEEIARELTRSVETALADASNSYVPEREAMDRLTAFIAEATAAAENYRQSRLQIMALVGDSRNRPAGAKTLRVAITEVEQTERLASVEAAHERLDAARKDSDAKIAAAKEQLIRHSGEAEARQILAALEAAKAQQALDEQKHQREQAKKKRAAALEKDLSEIKRSLVPFVTKGYTQPGPSQNVQTTDLAPMSLSKMAGKGALKPTQDGMAAADADCELGQ